MSKRKKIKLHDCVCDRPGVRAFGSRTRCSKCAGKMSLSPKAHAEMDYYENVVIPEVDEMLREEDGGVYLIPREGETGADKTLRLKMSNGEIDSAEWID